MNKVIFPGDLLEQLQTLAQQSPRQEVCGLVGAVDNAPCRVYPIENVAEDPQRHFTLHARQQIDAMRKMRQRNESLFAIYHSHPDGSSQPSARDIAGAAYPGVLYLIIAITKNSRPAVHAYYLDAGEATPVELGQS